MGAETRSSCDMSSFVILHFIFSDRVYTECITSYLHLQCLVVCLGRCYSKLLKCTEDRQGTFEQTQWKGFCNISIHLRTSLEGLVDTAPRLFPKGPFQSTGPVYCHSTEKMVNTTSFVHSMHTWGLKRNLYLLFLSSSLPMDQPSCLAKSLKHHSS